MQESLWSRSLRHGRISFVLSSMLAMSLICFMFVFQWCEPLHLHPGIQFFRLVVSLRDSRPDIIYLMGVEVKQGRGRYRHTHIVTLSPHFQLHNRSNHTLQFAQKCFATTVVRSVTNFSKPPCFHNISQGVGKLWNPKPWLWRQLAAAAQTVDSLHAVRPAVRAAAARWRQSQGLGFHRFPTPHWCSVFFKSWIY